MRIKNKEIKKRRHRKEQVIKAAAKALREQYGNKPAAEKPAPKPKAPRKVTAAAPAAGAGVAESKKPRKAPAKKKEEPAAE